MAENQGVNGDMWNNCAVNLLKLFGWEHIGDKNIDLVGTDSQEYGIDALMCYKSPSMAIKQSCLVESKRYSLNSLNASMLKKWIERLRQKLDALYQSEELVIEFPTMCDCCAINLGLIMCWIHDAPNEVYFHDDFTKYLSKAIISTMPKPMSYKRIVVLTNPQIIRLCAVAEQISKGGYQFVYPSQLLNDRPLVRSKILSVEYATSNTILAERINKDKYESVIFYFGLISIDAFRSLYESLIMYNILECEKKVMIYYYENNIKIREITPEIKKIFKDVDLELKALTHYTISIEPSIIKDYDDEQ